jgi:lysophospholipase L1-like esterase
VESVVPREEVNRHDHDVVRNDRSSVGDRVALGRSGETLRPLSGSRPREATYSVASRLAHFWDRVVERGCRKSPWRPIRGPPQVSALPDAHGPSTMRSVSATARFLNSLLLSPRTRAVITLSSPVFVSRCSARRVVMFVKGATTVKPPIHPRGAIKRRCVRFSGIAVMVGIAVAASAAGAVASSWNASWAASPMAPTPLVPNLANAGFSDQTVRNIVYTSVGGSKLRVQVSNTFGTGPVTVGPVTVGVELTGAQMVPSTVKPLTFGGRASVTVPAGGQVVSDAVSMRVFPEENLAISLYLPDATGPATYHSSAQQTNYVASGNQTSQVSGAAYTTTATSWYFLDRVDVRSLTTPKTVVAFGDSITDGANSQVGANDRWPNFLTRRLNAALGADAPSVVDEGIGGNRVLNDSPCFGVNALGRMNRDVLSVPGVKDVILLEGINDIGFSQVSPGPDDTSVGPGGPISAPFGCFSPNTNVSAKQIEARYVQIIAEAHLDGLKIFGGTLTPFKGAAYWSPAAEKKREAVNSWILHRHGFDGVINFAKATQDRFDPLYFNPAFNSGDNLHPNDAGYEAMGNAINLALLK